MKNLLKALAGFHATCGPVIKTSDNPFFKSRYASLEAIQEHVRKPLQLNGLVVTQTNKVSDGQAIVVSTVWHVESGESLYSEFPVVVGKHTAQDYGSAVTYAKRYSLTGLLNLTISDEDDDGNKASANVTQTKNVSEGNELPWLNESSPEWLKVVSSLKSGYTMADVRKKFKVSKAIETKLMSNN
jgi:imidazole glycerol phosphate synthase subunit HisF